MYRERKTWSSRKFGERIFFGEDDVFQMKEFRTTLIYKYSTISSQRRQHPEILPLCTILETIMPYMCLLNSDFFQAAPQGDLNYSSLPVSLENISAFLPFRTSQENRHVVAE